MATEYMNFEGKVSWAKLYEPDNAFGASNWKLNLFPKDEAEWDKIKAAGIQKKEKVNNDPAKGPIGKYLEFSRPAFKMIKGKMINFSGPVVLNNEDKVIVDYVNRKTNKRAYQFDNDEKGDIERRGKPIVIGNGSDVLVRVAVYDTLKGKGQRLESVKILDLIEYEQKERPLPDVVEDIRKPLVAIDKPLPQNNSLNDDIPF